MISHDFDQRDDRLDGLLGVGVRALPIAIAEESHIANTETGHRSAQFVFAQDRQFVGITRATAFASGGGRQHDSAADS